MMIWMRRDNTATPKVMLAITGVISFVFSANDPAGVRTFTGAAGGGVDWVDFGT